MTNRLLFHFPLGAWRRRPFTLIEILIAMVLTILVLTTLTFFYQQVIVIGAEIDQTKERDFYTRYVESRLADVLPKALSEKDKDFAFFSFADDGFAKAGSQSLIFSFDNGVSLDKEVANHAVGRLFVDPEGRLTLAYWPTPRQWDRPELPPVRKEILLEEVEALEFAFFIAPEKKQEPVPQSPEEEGKNGGGNASKKSQPANAKEAATAKKEAAEGEAAESIEISHEPKGDWRVLPWMKDFKQLPALIKVTVQKAGEKDKAIFMYPLVNSQSHIIYELP